MRFAIMFALFLAGAVPAFAEQKAPACTAHFIAYLYYQGLGLSPTPAITTDQAKWLGNQGKKKYPNFCFQANPSNATYVLVTIRGTQSREQLVTRSAITTGSWGRELGRWITTWQEPGVVSEPNATVLVFETKDGKPLSSTTGLRLQPIIQAKAAGKNAGRDALETALELWPIKLTSCASGSTAESCK
jgi:hypothetical protein